MYPPSLKDDKRVPEPLIGIFHSGLKFMSHKEGGGARNFPNKFRGRIVNFLRQIWDGHGDF